MVEHQPSKLNVAGSNPADRYKMNSGNLRERKTARLLSDGARNGAQVRILQFPFGELAERLKALVLKTRGGKTVREFESHTLL